MNALTKPELWQRIHAYTLDQPDAAFPFSARLARENDWEPEFAQRAIEEYKKFIYLLCASDRLLTPSEEVDAVWHQHLTYTRDYWDRFCKQTLKRQIHHGPTAGGVEESLKYRDSYRATLAAYAKEFEETPLADIWPNENIRFSPAGASRRVDPAKYMVVHRESAKLWGLGFVVAAGAATSIYVGFHPFGVAAIAAVTFIVIAPMAAPLMLKSSGDKKGGPSCGGGCGGGSNGCGGGCGGCS